MYVGTLPHMHSLYGVCTSACYPLANSLCYCTEPDTRRMISHYYGQDYGAYYSSTLEVELVVVVNVSSTF